MLYYVVDAFSDKIFGGNPAGVCVPDSWPEDELMRQITRENNLAETAFVVGKGPRYQLRWFTPAVEIDLCGHATLGTAFVLNRFYDAPPLMEFETLSGLLTVEAKGDLLEMNFPARAQRPVEVDQRMKDAVEAPIVGAYGGYNLMLELEDEKAVRDLRPDLAAVRSLTEYHGLIVTAAGSDCDFVSRFFAPGLGIDEDPVTGSTHTSLVPFWAERLGRDELTARQLSRRGGSIFCRNAGERVYISGRASLYLTGELRLDSWK